MHDLPPSSFFDDPADSAPFGRPTATRLPAIQEQVGQLQILAPIASGGMACVYKARHLELEVIRAVKILKPGYTRETRERFHTEAKVSANLHHPNIVQIYTVGKWEENVPYIEMEYVEGGSVDQMMTKYRRFEPVVAAAIARIVCRALDFAAQRTFTVYGKEYHGLVHRDIKPANILVSNEGVVKLVDFGIALPGSVSLHTAGQGVLGTFSYASPEQLNGQQVDSRTDVYSLGLVLYELITGQKAFSQDSVPELIKAKMTDGPQSLRSVAPGTPVSLVEAVEKSTACDREERYADAAQLGAVLDRAIAECSELDASDIVEHFIRDPHPARPRTTPVTRGSGRKFLALYAVSLFVLVVGMYAVIRFFDYTPNNETSVQATNNSDTRSGERPVRRESPKPASAPVPVESASAESVSIAENTDSVPAAEKQRIDYAGQGLAAYGTGNFREAIAHLEQALADTGAKVKPVVHLRLLDSYIRVGKIGSAVTLAESLRLDDGYVHLLRGKALLRAGRFDSAEKALLKAQTTPSRFDNDVQRKAVYGWARYREAAYRGKPNASNKKKALRAWRNYRRAFCTRGPEGPCREATRRIADLDG